MPKIILKYNLEPKDIQEIEIPVGSIILNVGSQQVFNSQQGLCDTIALWYLCPTQSVKAKRTFVIVATGQEFDDYTLRFLGTAMLPNLKLVYHIFEKL